MNGKQTRIDSEFFDPMSEQGTLPHKGSMEIFPNGIKTEEGASCLNGSKHQFALTLVCEFVEERKWIAQREKGDCERKKGLFCRGK